MENIFLAIFIAYCVFCLSFISLDFPYMNLDTCNFSKEYTVNRSLMYILCICDYYKFHVWLITSLQMIRDPRFKDNP